MFKRFFLFFGVNILIIAMLSIVLNLLGVRHYMTANGINYQALMIFCLVWGMGGAFISLFLSKFLAKMTMGVKIVSPTGEYSWLVQTVHQLARKAGLSKMPEVGVYSSSDMNAFATGATKNSSLVAVSTGLLQQMNQDELEGVLGHEVAHIANGDMVTMTLVQGVINAFVMFFARIAAFAVSQALRGDDEDGPGLGYFAHMMTVFAFEIIFGLLGSILVAWFSRFREFRADAGGASLAGKEKMIAALDALQRGYPQLSTGNKAMASMQISTKSSWLALFSSHPPLGERIKALQKMTSFRV
jgi:heat shock protein HtpX